MSDYEDYEELIDDIENEDDEKTSNDNKIYKIKNTDIVTKPYLSIFEFTRALSDRAIHIANGATPFISVDNMTSNTEIAYHEALQRKIPFVIVRSLGNNREDHINMCDMELPFDLPPKEYFIPSS